MKPQTVDTFICPHCQGKIELLSSVEKGKDEIKSGTLVCAACRGEFAIENHIPRFVPKENYAQSFGFQWNKHAKTQIDALSGMTLTYDRFFQVTGWAKDLRGQKIMEAGCGAGRFSHVALATGAELFSFDYSNAIDANFSNNGTKTNFYPFQGNIYAIPLVRGSFDKVFCLGVLQHCPDPKKAFMSLVPLLKPGGQIVVDIYDLTFRAFVNPKYWLRPLTRNMPAQKLYDLVRKWVPRLFPIKMWITEHIWFGKYLAFFIPVAYHKGFLPGFEKLTYNDLVEWSILDTFDKFAPKYDRPQTLNTMKRWCKEAGLKEVDVRYGPNGIVVRGVKP
jgi:SAM-dependent methyltransferase